MSERTHIPRDPEQQTPEDKPQLVLLTGTPVLPFDIDEYLAKHQRTRSWFTAGRLEPTEYPNDDRTISSSLLPERESLGATARQVLSIAMLLLLAFAIVWFGVRSLHASYPGTEKCYQVELWVHSVNSDRARIEWTIADAEEEVTSETEAEEVDERISQMLADLRSSLAQNQAPKEVAELKALWLRFLNLVFEVLEASEKGDDENLTRLKQERDEVLAQRQEEEGQVLRSCRLENTSPDPSQANGVGRQVPIRGAFSE